MFKPTEKLNTLELTPGADLLNPFGMEGYKDQEGEETYNEITLHTQSNPTTPIIPDALGLEELIDHGNVQKNGTDSMVDMGDGKHIHKAKVLHEFMRFTRTSNSTDHLRHVANISHFTQPLAMQHHHIGDDSIMETNCLLVQDPVAILLQCEGILFLGVAQVSAIKADKNNQSVILKDILGEEIVSITIQILHLRPLNVVLPNGKDGDWVWEHGQDATVVVPGKFICQINPKIIEISAMIRRGAEGERDEETLRKAVGYGFHSNEL